MADLMLTHVVIRQGHHRHVDAIVIYHQIATLGDDDRVGSGRQKILRHNAYISRTAPDVAETVDPQAAGGMADGVDFGFEAAV